MLMLVLFQMYLETYNVSYDVRNFLGDVNLLRTLTYLS
jgi:hypothetical protein